MLITKNNFSLRMHCLLGLSLAMLAVALCRPAMAALPGETKQQIDERMKWWRDARFGIFIHWGLYSIPAGQWDGKNVDGISSFIQKNAPVPEDEYATLKARFNPTEYDPNAWASLIKKAGAKYIVITSKHHEGFCLFDSKFTDYDVMDSPYGNDLLKPLAAACREQGLPICWYYSILDWHHHEAMGLDFCDYRKFMENQLQELLNNYGNVGVLWFDGEWIPEWKEEYGKDLEAKLHRIQPSLIVNDRIGRGRQITRAEKRKNVDDTREFAGDFGTPEQEIPVTGIPGFDWETCMTMNDTWGFKKQDLNWKSTPDLIRKLVDTASKGGNFLLNIGPTSQGLIPPESVKRLEGIGRWMEVNGESIYGTSANILPALPWGRSTTKLHQNGKPEKIFLHVFDWPQDGKLRVPGLEYQVNKAYMLAEKKHTPLEVSQQKSTTVINLPTNSSNEVVNVVVLEISEK